MLLKVLPSWRLEFKKRTAPSPKGAAFFLLPGFKFRFRPGKPGYIHQLYEALGKFEVFA